MIFDHDTSRLMHYFYYCRNKKKSFIYFEYKMYLMLHRINSPSMTHGTLAAHWAAQHRSIVHYMGTSYAETLHPIWYGRESVIQAYDFSKDSLIIVFSSFSDIIQAVPHHPNLSIKNFCGRKRNYLLLKLFLREIFNVSASHASG